MTYTIFWTALNICKTILDCVQTFTYSLSTTTYLLCTVSATKMAPVARRDSRTRSENVNVVIFGDSLAVLSTLKVKKVNYLNKQKYKYKYPKLVSNTRSGRGMRCDEARYCRSVNSKGAGRPRLTHHHTRADEMKRNG